MHHYYYTRKSDFVYILPLPVSFAHLYGFTLSVVVWIKISIILSAWTSFNISVNQVWVMNSFSVLLLLLFRKEFLLYLWGITLQGILYMFDGVSFTKFWICHPIISWHEKLLLKNLLIIWGLLYIWWITSCSCSQNFLFVFDFWYYNMPICRHF